MKIQSNKNNKKKMGGRKTKAEPEGENGRAKGGSGTRVIGQGWVCPCPPPIWRSTDLPNHRTTIGVIANDA